jgi:superfamily II DNA/RNA helicase
VIFTEHRDTLNYLEQRISTLLGRQEAVVIIHGGIGREERLKVQESFKHDPEVQVLLATDAAGEGINLQRAHLMVNYDLPWNPNRIEQRFGRIHRIGQTEVCHLWNLVADDTREGDVYRRLLEKLEQARQALGGQVFDVLGKLAFESDGKVMSLRDLLIEAIRYGEKPEVKAFLTTVLDVATGSGTPAEPARRTSARPRRHGRQPGAAHPRRHGARRRPPAATALHRVVLPRSLQAARRHRQTARAPALRNHPRTRPGAQSRPPDRHRRTRAAAL